MTCRASTTFSAISVCTAKISSSFLSYVCAQRFPSSRPSINCTEILTWAAAFLTLPSTRVSAVSSLAISIAPFEVVLYRIAEVLDMTLSRSILESAIMSSSVTPSAKYSFSGSELMFLNGRIAIVCLSTSSGSSFMSSTCIGSLNLGSQLDMSLAFSDSLSVARGEAFLSPGDCAILGTREFQAREAF